MDLMTIRDIKIDCIIGTKPVERKKKQGIIISVILECDLRKAGRTDRLEDTVNYKKIHDDIVIFVSASKFYLIEKLAEEISRICLKDHRVLSARVMVDKPSALSKASGAGVEIIRRRRN